MSLISPTCRFTETPNDKNVQNKFCVLYHFIQGAAIFLDENENNPLTIENDQHCVDKNGKYAITLSGISCEIHFLGGRLNNSRLP